ncbi:MAG: sugar ABC transporter permease [Bacilli bacterium]|nr:sugar ABC transporter permease [Bacilli bacterium]
MRRSVARKINRKNRTPLRKGDVIFYVALIALPLVQIAIFYFGVNFQSILMAFQKSVDGVFIFDIGPNWNKFVADINTKEFWVMIKNSILVYIFTSLSGTVLATIFSYYIYKRRTLSNLFKFVLFIPSILPGILLVVMFQMFVSSGVPAYADLLFGIKMPDYFSTDFATSDIRFILVTIFSIWISFGGQVLIYTAAMDQIPNEIIEAGKLDGTTSFTEFIHIILPSILATVGTFLIVGIASIFTNQNNLFSFFRPKDMQNTEYTFGYYMFSIVYSGGAGSSGYCYAAFLGLLTTSIVAPLTLLARKLLSKVTS